MYCLYMNIVRDIVINAVPTGLEVAVLENKSLTELYHEDLNRAFSVGDIFLGKIKKIAPGLNGVFIDIGHEKEAFLHYTDLGIQVLSHKKMLQSVIEGKTNDYTFQNFQPEADIVKTGKIADVLQKRDMLLVQISKEPIAPKGPRLTSDITLAGDYVVLVPFSTTLAISQKITQKEERQRLQKMVESLAPNNFGVIVRTAAEGKKVADLHEDINNQLAKWQKLFEQVKKASPGSRLLAESNSSSGILRHFEGGNFATIVVNDKNVAGQIKQYLTNRFPEQSPTVTYHTSNIPIFDYYKVTKQIKAAFGKTVPLASGAYLVVEHTEAMHVIDVNSGFRLGNAGNPETNALTVNLEAAAEIVRQLRLRDLGGLIAIDFIDVRDPEHKKMIHRRMTELMADDKVQHTILPLNMFSVMQITRQRTRPALQISTAEVCPSCKGTGKVKSTLLVLDEIESTLSYLLNEMDYRDLRLVTHPFLEAFIKKGFVSIQWKWFWQLRKWITVLGNNNYYLTEYRFFDANNEEIKL